MLFIYSTWSLVSKNGASYRIWSTYEWVIAQRRKEGSNSMLWSTGCPKKMHNSCFLVIMTLWNELGRKVGMFPKIQEIFYLIDTKIFQFDLLEDEKIGSKDGNPTWKIWKKWKKFLWMEVIFLDTLQCLNLYFRQ